VRSAQLDLAHSGYPLQQLFAIIVAQLQRASPQPN
jgi:hypothetical protein